MQTITVAASDPTLVAAALAGDDEAFRQIVNRHQGVVRGLLRRMTRDHDQAEDLAQNTFVQAWQKLDTWRGGSLRSWLCTIATRMLFHELRRSDPLRGAVEETGTLVASSPDPGRQMDLDRALEMLNSEQRLVLLLSFTAGMSHAEIVAATGWPLGTVKSHAARGKQRLHSALEAYAHEST